jgi:hypothetical protein
MTSTRYNTALKFISAFKAMDLPTIMSIRAPNCMHQMAPASLGSRPPLNNEAYETSIARFSDIVTEWPAEAKEIMEDEKQNRVVVWATSKAVWKKELMDGDSKDWDWQGEYMFILCMDESGERLVRVVEFLDSKRTEELRALVARAAKNLGNLKA